MDTPYFYTVLKHQRSGALKQALESVIRPGLFEAQFQLMDQLFVRAVQQGIGAGQVDHDIDGRIEPDQITRQGRNGVRLRQVTDDAGEQIGIAAPLDQEMLVLARRCNVSVLLSCRASIWSMLFSTLVVASANSKQACVRAGRSKTMLYSRDSHEG